MPPAGGPTPPISQSQTPETYLGTDRGERFASPDVVQPGSACYTFPGGLPDDGWAASGTFDFQSQYALASAAGDRLELSFYARDVYLVPAADCRCRRESR